MICNGDIVVYDIGDIHEAVQYFRDNVKRNRSVKKSVHVITQENVNPYACSGTDYNKMFK